MLKKRRCFASLPLEATPVPAEGTLAASPRGQKERPHPAPGRTTELGDPRHQDRALGPPGDRRLWPGRAETSGGTFCFLDNPHLRESRSRWMRRQKNRAGWGGSLSLGERRMTNELPPSSHPFPD